MIRKKILVAMSGGVDSAVAAALLKEEGHEVSGATFVTHPEETGSVPGAVRCCGTAGVEDARKTAEHLGIPHYVFHFEKEFREKVMDEFAEEYRAGRTPNPCVSCNEHIKFDLFWKRACGLNFDGIATGHYAGIGYDESKNRYFIEAGSSSAKEQSYFLYPLSQEILMHTVFPLRNLSKSEVRGKANELGLRVWSKKSSQEICFVPDGDYAAFLVREYGFCDMQGDVRMKKDGSVIGGHPGYFHFTRGQRRGLRIACGERAYIVDIDRGKNEIFIGGKQDLLERECLVSRIRWAFCPEATKFRAEVRVRYLHKKAWATLYPEKEDQVRIVFDEPQEAMTKGQSAVFYDGNRILGGGRIELVLGMSSEFKKGGNEERYPA